MSLPKLNFITQQDASTSTVFDGAIILFSDKNALVDLIPSAKRWSELDASFGDSVQLLVPEDRIPSQRVIISPVGSLHDDFDDVRRYKDAGFAAGQRALKAGITSPVIYFADTPSTQGTQSNLHWTFNDTDDYEEYLSVTVLGFLEAAFDPIDARTHFKKINQPAAAFTSLNLVSPVQISNQDEFENKIIAIESGRRIAKDIGSPDPEIMSPENIVKYIRSHFQDDSCIQIKVIEDIETIKKEYPLAHAVTRASLAVSRHHPRFVMFEYKSPDQSKVKENLYFVGKGVTYDTGGADIKCGGNMRGMSRDKCGAAAVAGFFKTIEYLKPSHVNVTAGIALVRNSIGPDSYVSDEVIYSRNGTRVLVGNTDAEGRMVMTDLLCEFKERIIAEKATVPSFVFTVATLTGHAVRAYNGYGITMDNGFSRKHKISQRIYDGGHIMADPFEISTFRREDVACVQPGRSSEDIVQANDKPSTMTNRGHQYPAGFMLLASGLDKHGLNHELPIGYTHVDIAGSAELMSSIGWSLPRVTGSPVAALTDAFLIPK
ncbi:hypothetical protein BDF21DRAFT_360987 [Thamnidium elegans]|uniref:Cytosol aminopeptidase domain-containing protein n=1 Tax=Thamnidium elegans TaxID=101142 RepID=A0A8H7VYQ2_9FUNG|nr:hypothetical protein INT48_009392 [Thamnidium elegans]KAI8082068.1 hypothetical protein BDF21DRAFT_360987 [Thamnidium elegans]